MSVSSVIASPCRCHLAMSSTPPGMERVSQSGSSKTECTPVEGSQRYGASRRDDLDARSVTVHETQERPGNRRVARVINGRAQLLRLVLDQVPHTIYR